MSGKGAGVYPLNAQNIALFEEVGQGAFARPVAMVGGVLAHQDGGGLYLRGLLVAGDDAVVADERVGEEHDLATIRGIRQGLLVADHAGREDDLPGNLAFASKGPARNRDPVLEDDQRPAPPFPTPVLQILLPSRRTPARHRP